jgi:hypothetical protein
LFFRKGFTYDNIYDWDLLSTPGAAAAAGGGDIVIGGGDDENGGQDDVGDKANGTRVPTHTGLPRNADHHYLEQPGMEHPSSPIARNTTTAGVTTAGGLAVPGGLMENSINY